MYIYYIILYYIILLHWWVIGKCFMAIYNMLTQFYLSNIEYDQSC